MNGFPETSNTETLLQKYDTIIRNNKIVQDNDYNSKTYFTKKIKTEDLVIPAEIKEQAKKIYFLVEEGNNVFYAKWLALEADMMSIDTVEEFLEANDLSKLQQVYLLHLSDNNSNANKFKDRIQKKTGAEVYVY